MLRFFAFLLLPLSALAGPSTSSQVDRYVQLHFRAEAALRDFDQELSAAKEPGFLRRSMAHRELQALRSLKEATAHDLSLKGVDPSRFGPAERVALQDLIENIRHHGGPAVASLPKAPFPTLDSLLRHLGKHKAEIDAEVEKARRSDRFEAEIDARIQALTFDETEEPTVEAIRPDPGPDGNVTGYTFPERTWALTYDDGPSATNSLPILALLHQHEVRATYFLVAENLAENQPVIDLQKSSGMALECHSFTHLNLPKQNDETLKKEIIEATELTEKVAAQRPRFFRLPYGSGLKNTKIRRMIADQNMVHVFWNVDSLDWQDKKPESIVARVKKQMGIEKKGIILMHDIHAQTVEATRLLLDHSSSRDGKPDAVRWVTLPQVVDEMNAKSKQ